MSFLIRIVTSLSFAASATLAYPAGAQMPYSKTEFTTDCRHAGGTAWLDKKQAICVLQNQKDILCAINASGVFDCALDPKSKGASSRLKH